MTPHFSRSPGSSERVAADAHSISRDPLACLGRQTYFGVTAREAEPPRLLRTVMFCGLVTTLNLPVYRPAPADVSLPINAFVDVT